MLEGGADIRYIQEILGHASIETTQVYTRVSIEHLKRVHNLASTLTHPAKLVREPAPATATATATVPAMTPRPTPSEKARADLLADLDLEHEAEAKEQ